jgi:hypothetical protein
MVAIQLNIRTIHLLSIFPMKMNKTFLYMFVLWNGFKQCVVTSISLLNLTLQSFAYNYGEVFSQYKFPQHFTTTSMKKNVKDIFAMWQFGCILSHFKTLQINKISGI